MKIFKVLLLITSFLLIINDGKLYCSNGSISVTYIANCGFLIEIGSQKIIVDGLFKRGHNRYSTPDTTMQQLLVTNQYPFNDVNLILVSHIHEDHFDAEMVNSALLNNKNTLLICPGQVVDKLVENDPVYKIVKSQIIECTPDLNSTENVKAGKIEIVACRLAHPGERHKNVQNIAYLIKVNGKSVFHSADADPL